MFSLTRTPHRVMLWLNFLWEFSFDLVMYNNNRYLCFTRLFQTLWVNDILVLTVKWTRPTAHGVRLTRSTETFLQNNNKKRCESMCLLFPQHPGVFFTFHKSVRTSSGTCPSWNKLFIISKSWWLAMASFSASSLTIAVWYQWYLKLLLMDRTFVWYRRVYTLAIATVSLVPFNPYPRPSWN